jgi:hypothetical protein
MRIWYKDRYIIDERDDALECFEAWCDTINETYHAAIMMNQKHDWVKCRETEAAEMTESCLNARCDADPDSTLLGRGTLYVVEIKHDGTDGFRTKLGTCHSVRCN